MRQSHAVLLVLTHLLLFGTPDSFAGKAAPSILSKLIDCLEVFKTTDPGPKILHQLFFRAGDHLGIVAKQDPQGNWAAFFFGREGPNAGVKRFRITSSKGKSFDLSPRGIIDPGSVLHFGPGFPPDTVTMSMGVDQPSKQVDAPLEIYDPKDQKVGTLGWVIRTFLTDILVGNTSSWDDEAHEKCSALGDASLVKSLDVAKKKKFSQ